MSLIRKAILTVASLDFDPNLSNFNDFINKFWFKKMEKEKQEFYIKSTWVHIMWHKNSGLNVDRKFGKITCYSCNNQATV